MEPRPVDAYDTLQERLERVIRRLCPPWLRNDADDLVQAAQLKIFRRGDPVDALEDGFLYRVGYSVMVDEIRRRKRRHEFTIDTLESPEPADPVEHDPERLAAGQEAGAAIHQCLSELPVDHRRAVVLRLQGHTVPEIAELLDIKPKTAENRVYRGMATLRAALGRRGYP